MKPANEQEQQRFDALSSAIGTMASTSSAPVTPGPRGEELRVIYAQRHEWARHFNGLIWSISAILLPVALGGLALSFRDDNGCLNTASLVSTAVGSSLLLLFWGLICGGQRRLWEREYKIMHLIEAAWGLRPAPQSIEDAGGQLFSTGSGYVRGIRMIMVIVGIMVWGFRVLVELKVGLFGV